MADNHFANGSSEEVVNFGIVEASGTACDETGETMGKNPNFEVKMLLSTAIKTGERHTVF